MDRRQLLLLIFAAVALAGAVGFSSGDVRPSSREASLASAAGLIQDPARAHCPATLPTVRVGDWPGPCWRPYSDRSPFNRPLPAEPRWHPRSAAIVSRLTGFGPLQHLLAGQVDTDHDYGRPTYYSRPGDPFFKLECGGPRRWCPIDGRRIRIPDRARPAGGSDGHMTVVDQRSGWEYDFWRVRSKPRGGGKLKFVNGGRTRLAGSGLGPRANAARYGNLAGLLRAEELAAGRIDHALLLVVKCDSGEHVFPASARGRTCSRIGLSNANAPAMGTRLALDMSEDEIRALSLPAWKQAILLAMARYGMYVGDTGGSWGIKTESSATYTSFGRYDRWTALARRAGVPYHREDRRWVFNLRSGVDWPGRLRVVHPCETLGSCAGS